MDPAGKIRYKLVIPGGSPAKLSHRLLALGDGYLHNCLHLFRVDSKSTAINNVTQVTKFFSAKAAFPSVKSRLGSSKAS